jgi:hypothetical protein
LPLIKSLRFFILAALLFFINQTDSPAQNWATPEVTLDSFTVRASRLLSGRVDTADLMLAARAAVEGDSIKHNWLLHFSPVELRSEESYRSFPGIRFFRFFTPNFVTPPGHCVAIDREGKKAYLIYQSGAADDLGDLALNLGVQIGSDTAALDYFMDILQIRGQIPAIALDTVAEIRQYARYRERVSELKLSELPPVRRLYRHLWKDKSFAVFRTGALSDEKEEFCREVEKDWGGMIVPPAVNFNKGQFHVSLYLTRLRNLYEIFKISGFVSPEGQVSYTVIKLNQQPDR